MPVLTITCISPRPFQRAPRITIPNLGILEQAHAAISSIPDPAELMAMFMDKLSLALAPLRKYLQVLEGLIAIKQCVEALPRAIITLSPSPIFDCLKALVRAFAALIQDIPPIPYIQCVIDLCKICVDLIDAIVNLLVKLDNKISALLTLRNYALALNDTDLVDITGCSLQYIKIPLQQIMQVLKLIKPLNDILLSVIMRLIPTPQAQKAAEEYQAAAGSFDTCSTQLATIDPAVLGFPSLSGMMPAIGATRNAMVVIHNVLAPIIGEDPSLTTRTLPSFTNF
jgi:hypothetical protein